MFHTFFNQLRFAHTINSKLQTLIFKQIQKFSIFHLDEERMEIILLNTNRSFKLFSFQQNVEILLRVNNEWCDKYNTRYIYYVAKEIREHDIIYVEYFLDNITEHLKEVREYHCKKYNL